MAERHDTRAARRASRARNESLPTSLPADRFERLPKTARVGAHRVVGKPRRFWIYLVSALLGIALLTAAGIIVIQLIGTTVPGLGEDRPEPTKKSEKVKAELDPTAPVVVLNGTGVEGFETVVDGIITENGWGQILFSSPADSSDVKISAVFYSTPADEPAAVALARELGGVSTFKSTEHDEYGAKLTVLLGADYAGPGSDQLAAGEVAQATGSAGSADSAGSAEPAG